MDNNLSGEIARKRDIFLEAEREYLDVLKKDAKCSDFIEELSKKSPIDLSKEVFRRIEAIENGEVQESKLERVETEITLLFAAIQDIERERVKERLLSTNEKDEEDELSL